MILQFCVDIYCASSTTKDLVQSFGTSLKNSFYFGELSYLSITNWSYDIRQKFLQILEKILLRTHITSHPSSSFSSLLFNNLTTHSHPGDIGITSIYRSYLILWKFYFLLEISHNFLILKYQSYTSGSTSTITKYLQYEDLEKRLILFYRGNELNYGNEELIVGHDLSILQGSLRMKSIWLESYLGDLLLLHIKLEKYKKKKKENKFKNIEGTSGTSSSSQMYPSEENEEENGNEDNEKDLILNEIKNIMERREIMCRIIS